jgi:DNA (cytosine-5)-methyltransferase 1
MIAHTRFDELIVDLFAGGGGASEAILAATGRHPDIAINHDPEAVALHKANHPTTRHICSDIAEADPIAVCAGRRVGLLWASPDCTHHSKARGGKPAEKKIRSLAWHVVKWAAKVRPRVIALENVEEFQDWGPLDAAGHPVKARKGETFKVWCGQLRGLGYAVEHRELVAADYGAPTTRKRLFLIARCDGQPIRWPAKTHGPRSKSRTADLFEPALPTWRAAAEIIDWSLLCPSIFGRRKALAPKTRTRIARGIKRFVVEAHSPFIVPVTHSGSRRTPGTDEPLATVTSANRGEHALSVPTIEAAMIPGIAHGDHARGAGLRVHDPRDALGTVHAQGGNFSVATAALAGASIGVGGRAGQSPPRGLDQPVNTVTAKGDRAIAAAHLMRTDMQSAADRNGIHGANDPLRTVTSAGGFAISAAHLTKFREGSSGADAAEPMPTVTANSFVKRPGGAVPLGVVAAHISKFSENSIGTDPAEPLHTAMAGAPRHGLVVAHLGRQFGTSTGSEASTPMGTVMPQGAGKTQIVAAHIEQANTKSIAADAAQPLPTVTAKAKQGIVAASLDAYYATGGPASPEDPLRTATALPRHGLTASYLEQANTGMTGHDVRDPVSTIVGGGASSGWGTTQRLIEIDLTPSPGSRREQVLAFLWEHFGEPTDEERRDPLASARGRLRFGLVILDGYVWQIADIGMRMLTPRELYGAQGFRPDYVIEIEFEGRPLTKTAQTRMAGNSVSPPPAAALLRANLPDGLAIRRAA